MTFANPFTFGRFEHENHPIIYMPETYQEFASGKNYHIHGSRGTGKTAILRSVSWEDQSGDGTFRKTVEEFGEKRVIGLYTRIADFQLPPFDWLEHRVEIQQFLFGTCFALMHCQLICKALADLPAKGYVNIPARSEMQFAKDFFSEFHGLCDLAGPITETHTFSGVEDRLFELQMIVHGIALHQREPSDIPNQLLRPFLPLLQEFTGLLLDRVRELQGWRFILCLDEAEVFALWQQKVINSFVRASKFPWSYLIAALAYCFELEETTIPNQLLGADDRTTKLLDDLSREDFERFANGIASARFGQQDCPGQEFSLDTLLGHVTVNALLQKQLASSEQREARILLEEAQSNREYFARADPLDPPPIYETWIKRSDSALPTAPVEDAFDRRRIGSSHFRKKHLSAYHNICLHFGLSPIYVDYDTVIGLSDFCVRDLLHMLYRIMAYVPESWLDTKLRSKLPLSDRIQNSGIRQAAADKRTSTIKDEVVSDSGKVDRLIDNLGRLWRSYQRSPYSIVKAGIGILRIRHRQDEMTSDLQALLAVIQEAHYCGLVHANMRPMETTLRLHTMLNPDFDLPGRRPSYDMVITAAEAVKLLSEQFQERTAERLWRRLDSKPTPLFD